MDGFISFLHTAQQVSNPILKSIFSEMVVLDRNNFTAGRDRYEQIPLIKPLQN